MPQPGIDLLDMEQRLAGHHRVAGLESIAGEHSAAQGVEQPEPGLDREPHDAQLGVLVMLDQADGVEPWRVVGVGFDAEDREPESLDAFMDPGEDLLVGLAITDFAHAAILRATCDVSGVNDRTRGRIRSPKKLLSNTATMPADLDMVCRVQQMRRRLAEGGPERMRADGDVDRVALPAHDGDVLRGVLLAENARVVIEIGLAYGSSALAIAEALVSHGSDSTDHVIIDPFQDQFHDAGWGVVVAAGLGGTCSLLPERSQLALPRLLAEGFVADAAFVDGSHIFHNVFVDLFFLRELVRPGGVVILDDCHWASVATAVRYFELNTGWRREPIDPDSRLRVYRLPEARREPRFEDFVSF